MAEIDDIAFGVGEAIAVAVHLVSMGAELSANVGLQFSLVGRHVAELGDDQQFVGGKLALQTQQPLLIAPLHQLVHDGGSRDEADRQPPPAGGEPQPESDVALARAG